MKSCSKIPIHLQRCAAGNDCRDAQTFIWSVVVTVDGNTNNDEKSFHRLRGQFYYINTRWEFQDFSG
jgi:hypothetical protein